MATVNPVLREKAVRSALNYAGQVDWSISLPEFATRIHEIVKEDTENSDPYAEEKRTENQIGRELCGHLKEMVDVSSDSLLQSAKVAISGNVIDLAPGYRRDLKQVIHECLDKPLDVDDFALLRMELEKTDRLLYLADNAGEVFFDRVFIEELVTRDISVTYVVKGGSILNDATAEDAYAAGIQDFATIISNGVAAVGTQLGLCSQEFRSIFHESPLIISKGQANYESLDAEKEKLIFFMLRAKCPVIAESLGVPVGATVLRSSQKIRQS